QCVVHVPDVLAESDAEFGTAKEIAVRCGYRACLAVPMLREGKSVGSIIMRRTEARPFSNRQIDLLKTIADQAVIAIENTRLFNELEKRNRDLTESLEQQTATSEILRVISQSQRDVQPVFETIAANARKLCRATTGSVNTFDGEVIHYATAEGFNSEAIDTIRQDFPMPPSRGSATGRAILTRAVSYIPDIHDDPEYRMQRQAASGRFCSVLSVPMLREGNPIGTINVTGTEHAMFSERQIAMLQ